MRILYIYNQYFMLKVTVSSLLKQCCIVIAFFGIASFNVNGKTLHSLLRLPIRGKNKGYALIKLQEDLNG